MIMDPFGSKTHTATASISTQHTLTPDIYEPLFDRIFFQSEEFAYWSQGNQPWQLHCFGAPGCGKVRCALAA
jgi:hypothetical protein